MERFTTALGAINLDRLPRQPDNQLLAWDSADELILQHAKDIIEEGKTYSILIVNDQFGALATALSQHNNVNISSWSDSYVSQLATINNLNINQFENNISFVTSTQQPHKCFDIILLKIPKVTALLEQQLNGLSDQLNTDCQIVASGMCKHMPKSVYSIFEKYVGSTSTSLAKKKSRLIFVKDENKPSQALNYPVSYYEPSLDIELRSHANVFSKEHLDIGARFFIEQFDQLPASNTIIDLGCGNGVLGIIAHRFQPTSQIHFVDESHMALLSAQENYANAYDSEDQPAEFHISDCLDQCKINKVDLILCNPPFHQQHSTGDQTAWRMFRDSHKKLNVKGELWVIANRNLAYHVKLKRLFTNCTTIASNKKFVVLRSIKT